MTNIQSTPTPELAAMVRARCPEWCVHRVSSSPHDYRLLEDGSYHVKHRGADNFDPLQLMPSLKLGRDVLWTAEGGLISSIESVTVQETIIATAERARLLLEAITRAMNLRPSPIAVENDAQLVVSPPAPGHALLPQQAGRWNLDAQSEVTR